MVSKWSGVLSTTEPRNDIGILNVRQGNKNSEIAEFQIIENNKPYDLTGLTVLFCASFGLNQVEKTASVVNAKEGKISYTFDDDAMQQVGRNKGYFSIKKAEAMIDSTQEFEYRIQSSIYSRLIDAKSYILRLDVLIKLIEDFIYESKNNVSASIKSFESFITNEKANVNTWVDSMKEIIYGIDPGGSVLRELIEARKDTLNKIFPSLKARLDTFETDTTAQFQQTIPHVDTTFKSDGLDKIRKMVSDSKEGLVTGTFIEVGDSTRASNGAFIYSYLSKKLKEYNVNTHLVARSGLKAEHWSTYTPNLQPGYPTIDDVISLIPGDGKNVAVDVCLGINDGLKTVSEIETYIKFGVDKIKTAKPNVLINLTSPNRYSDGAVVNKLITVYENLVNKYGYGYINVLENVFRKWDSKVESIYFIDSTHPNELGQTRMADYIIPKFLPNYNSPATDKIESIVLKTGDIPPNYYVKMATIRLNKRYYGFSGSFFIQAIPGDGLKPSNALVSVSVTQYTALGTDADKQAKIKLINHDSANKDFSNDSITLRTVSITPTQTIVEIYLRNVGITGKYFKALFMGDTNGPSENTEIELINSLSGRVTMADKVSGTNDAKSSYVNGSFLGSPDGSLWKISIGNDGALTTVKV